MDTICCQKCSVPRDNDDVEVLECKHQICIICLTQYCKDILRTGGEMKCFIEHCPGQLSDSLIRNMLPDAYSIIYEKYQWRKTSRIFECLNPDCDHFVTSNNPRVIFECTECGAYNCSQCQACHRYMQCSQYSADPNGEGKYWHEKELRLARKQNAAKRRASIEEASKMKTIPNEEAFECPLCFNIIRKGQGVLLRNCLHFLCRRCLAEFFLNFQGTPECPECNRLILDQDGRGVLSKEEEDIYDHRQLYAALPRFKKPDFCRKLNCGFLCEVNSSITDWLCPKCKELNCRKCNAIHSEMSCKEYQSSTPIEDDEYIKQKIRDKELMRCLKCKTLLQKTKGCNWIQCTNCGTELCWITQKLFRGPQGCNCRPGKLCHEDCGGCVPYRNEVNCRLI